MKRLWRIVGVVLIAAISLNVAYAVYGDILLERRGPTSEADFPRVVFPHWFHRIRYKCYACHTEIFEMKAGANEITMEAILAGKFCGECHNGQIAWAASFDTCSKCHVGQ